MIQVLLCSADDSLATRLREAIGDAFWHVQPAATPPDAAALAALLPPGSQPDIAIVDSNGDEQGAMTLISSLADTTPVLPILVTPAAQVLAFSALRAGARDVLDPSADVEELRSALDRVAERVLLPAPVAAPSPTAAALGREGRIITVTSPKGGVGKTTLATNLAVELARRAPRRVVLVDADVHFGDVASALNLQPDHTLPDIACGPAAADTIALKSHLSEHSTGLYVVPGSESPAAADAVTPGVLGQLLVLLRSLFEYVVVDTAPGLGEHTLSCLDLTDSLVLVTSLDVPGVRGLRKEIDTLDSLDLITGTRHVVVNFHDKSRGLTISDVEATIRASVDVVLPTSRTVPLSTNQGIPLTQHGGRDPVARRVRDLVTAIIPESEENAPAKARRKR